ncbi:MAG TPA: flagellar biosynthetic protein FliR, partial [Brevundimonas sp.]|nr:flagellar biosynthetic protein FliR [Brevundimonas sp.]
MEGYATADQVWGAALVFARLGAILMLLPGLGETYVPPRIRLSLALVITLVVWPIAAPVLPALPESVGGMAGWVIREVATG